jgi:hypothetical protein
VAFGVEAGVEVEPEVVPDEAAGCLVVVAALVAFGEDAGALEVAGTLVVEPAAVVFTLSEPAEVAPEAIGVVEPEVVPPAIGDAAALKPELISAAWPAW